MGQCDFFWNSLYVYWISDSSSEADAETSTTTQQSAESSDLLQKTQQELDQIYSATESIMSTSSRLSKSLSKDSQHLFLGSTEPVLRNSVMISIDTQRLSSSVESSDRNTEKDDSRCSQQNPFSETSRSVFKDAVLCNVNLLPCPCALECSILLLRPFKWGTVWGFTSRVMRTDKSQS